MVSDTDGVIVSVSVTNRGPDRVLCALSTATLIGTACVSVAIFLFVSFTLLSSDPNFVLAQIDFYII